MDCSKIEYLGLDRVLRRGTGEVLEENERALFVYDTRSGAYLLACEDRDEALRVLDRHADRDYRLLMVSREEIGRAAFERYGFADRLVCFQAAWYGDKPAPGSGLSVRTADEGDLPLLLENYDLISPEEMKRLVGLGNLLLGYDGDRLVGFIGEHLEGSMGLLYVFPEQRRRGYAEALEKLYIARTMEKGFLPFGQVETDNPASLALQRKLGMTLSERPICWMWK